MRLHCGQPFSVWKGVLLMRYDKSKALKIISGKATKEIDLATLDVTINLNWSSSALYMVGRGRVINREHAHKIYIFTKARWKNG